MQDMAEMVQLTPVVAVRTEDQLMVAVAQVLW
jgi:hypothetical protein